MRLIWHLNNSLDFGELATICPYLQKTTVINSQSSQKTFLESNSIDHKCGISRKTGLILTTYCVRYSHEVPFSWIFMPFFVTPHACPFFLEQALQNPNDPKLSNTIETGQYWNTQEFWGLSTKNPKLLLFFE